MGKYIMVSLDDDSGKSLSEVLTNDTCKKIINFLSDHDESTESDIAKKLNLPLNTVNYNMRKLIHSKLVDEAPHFFWSKKGKKIRVYRISNKAILITPKVKSKMNKTLTSIITIASAVVAGSIIRLVFHKQISPLESQIYDSSEFAIATTQKIIADSSAENISHLSTIIASVPSWGWFVGGSVFALIIMLILNWKKL